MRAGDTAVGAFACRLSRALLAAGELAAGCGEVLAAAVRVRRAVPVPRVSVWPAAGCVLLTVGWVAWVAWLVGGNPR